MMIGYGRVSTGDQDLALQVDALKKYGCEQLYLDKASGKKMDRPELMAMLRNLREGDTLVIWTLDRLGRSLTELVNIVSQLNAKGINFVSLMQKIDTTSAFGELTFHFFAALAQYERTLIVERTNAGLAAAKARGRVGGRPPALDATQLQQLLTLSQDPLIKVSDIISTMNISRATYYNYLKAKKISHAK